MQYTTNYSLKKPQYADEADIEVINDNTDDVDTLIHQNRTMIAPAFDNTKAYVTGDPVEYLGALYVFTSDKAAGAWDASKVEPTTAAEMGGGGASALADLDDVEITSPTDGQTMKYNSTSQKWENGNSDLGDLGDVEITTPTEGQALVYNETDEVWENQTLPDPSVTKIATGNPIEFTDGADAPLVKCVSAITGSQDLHGYDKPWVGGAGKNKGNFVDGYNINPQGEVVPYSSTPRCATIEPIPIEANTTYYVKRLGAQCEFIYAVWNGDTLVRRVLITSGTALDTSGGDKLYVCAYDGTVAYLKPMVTKDSLPNIYEPYSNICPITAYTEGEIEVRGKNLIDDILADLTQGSIDGSDGSEISSTTRVRSKMVDFDYDAIVSGGYTFTIPNGYKVALRPYKADGTFVFVDSSVTGFVSTLPAIWVGQCIKKMRYVFAKNDDSTVTPSSIANKGYQIERGTTATAYEPYTSTTHTTTFPSAIYRGSEDCVKGSVECEWKKVVFDGTENWQAVYQNGHYRYTNVAISDIKKPSANNVPVHAVTNIYQVRAADLTYMGYDGFSVQSGTSGVVYIYDSRFDAENKLADFKSALSQENLVVAYELATPTTSSVTSTNLPIRTLSGYNHIESSTGEMEIEYITKGEQAIVDLIDKSDHIYSTQEQAVGTWVDGKTLYEKTIVKQNISSASSSTVLIPSSELTGMNIVEISGSYVSRTSNSTYAINAYINSNTIIATWLAEDDIYYWLYWGAADTYDAYITIRYTKSSSNNRSLSKGGGEQETKQEVKEEPTEETKEENENNEAER